MNLIVIAGGGSPNSIGYGPVYDLLKEESKDRGGSATILDFVGCGHAPDPGEGLRFSTALTKVKNCIKNGISSDKKILFARSFGCNIAVAAIAELGEEAGQFEKIILWGPSPFHTYWSLFGSSPQGISEFNRRNENKGLRIASEFWNEMRPIEEDLANLSSKNVVIARGTNDRLCRSGFVKYLVSICEEKYGYKIDELEVKDAGHEVTRKDNSQIVKDYINLIFSACAV